MSSENPDVILVQPNAEGRLSGGYLYNRRMAQGSVWNVVDADPGGLVNELSSVDARAVVLDSIWLTESYYRPFQSLRERGMRLGTILHSLPSMIEAAEAGATPRLRPTDAELRMLSDLDFVVVLGPHFEQMLASWGIDVTCIPPGIDDEWRQPSRDRKGRLKLISVGAVTPRKGFLDLAEVLQQVDPTEVSWTIVGSLDVDRAYAASVQRCARRIGDSERPCVAFLGQLPPDQVRMQVQAADLLVMPSYDENHPLVLLEAMAAGVPCLAYQAGAAKSMLADPPFAPGGKRGVTVPIGDRDGLQEHLGRLIEDEPERRRMAAACDLYSKNLPNWSDAARFGRERLATLLR